MRRRCSPTSASSSRDRRLALYSALYPAPCPALYPALYPLLCLALFLGLLAGTPVFAASCKGQIYLTLDTGHMGVAGTIADVLSREQVPVTFFAANEPTQVGDGTLGEAWAPWWRAQAAPALNHDFASHTLDHVYWRADLPQPDGSTKFRMRPSAGPGAGQDVVWTAQQYCDSLRAASARLRALTGRETLPLFRAPGGRTSPALIRAAGQCGYAHVGWADAGFLGDELPSDRYPNDLLLRQALQRIQPGDVLMAHLGIWSRREPWAPAVLEPLIRGLKARGLCFASLRTHPAYREWIAGHPDPAR